MTLLKSFTISAGTTEVFNLEVKAPDAETALALAKDNWNRSDLVDWTPCGALENPRFQVEDECDVPDPDIRTYDVSYTVTDRLHAQIKATSKDEALRIAEALRDQNGTYEGDFDVVDSDLSEMEVEEVVS
ncbi:MAG: hypothetical protein ABL982_14970 [Vicinamibacterales bacterium]